MDQGTFRKLACAHFFFVYPKKLFTHNNHVVPFWSGVDVFIFFRSKKFR
jgi:hypothetical protein